MKRFIAPIVICSVCFLGCDTEVSKTGGSMSESAKAMTENMKDKAKDAVGDAVKASGMTDLLGKASEALASVEGGSDMLKNVQESFGSLTSTLSGISDGDSATAALPKLSQLTDSFGGMNDLFSKLPDAAKSAVSGVFSSSLGEIKPIIDKIMAIPGVESILKPAIDALMEKLAAFKV